MPELSPDHNHVLLDALTALTKVIETGDDAPPWKHYDNTDESDPKITSEGYERLMAEARLILEERL